MKVLLLFSNTTVRQGKAFPDDLRDLLQQAADERGEQMEFYVGYARSLSYLISNGRVNIRDHRNHMNLEEYDFVYFRKAGTAMQQMQTCAYYLKDRGVPFWDSELLRANSRNKLSQMIMLERRGLPIPPTLFCRNRQRLVRLVTKKYADIFSFPVVVKATGGSRGEANYLIHDATELIAAVKGELNRSFMVQAYIPNDGDYRFFVAGGKLRGVIGRKPVEGSHLSNTSKGATAEILPYDTFGRELVTLSVQAAQIFGRDVAGVDVMFDSMTNEPYFLEVNRAPQIEHASFEREKADWMVRAIASAVTTHQPQPIRQGGDAGRHIGRFEYVHFADSEGHSVRTIAKVDTGADSSSVHVDYIAVRNDVLHFGLLGKDMSAEQYYTKRVRSSSGEIQMRYYVTIPMSIGGKVYMLKTTLSDRSAMKHTALIGRRFLREHRLLVDVSRRFVLSAANRQQQNKRAV